MVLLLTLPKEYPYLLIGLTANFTLCSILGVSIAFPARKKVFNKDSLLKH